MPHLSIQRFDIPGEFRGIHQRGAFHAITHGRSKLLELLEIPRQIACDLNVPIFILRDQFRQVRFARLADAEDERAVTGDWETEPAPYTSWL